MWPIAVATRAAESILDLLWWLKEDAYDLGFERTSNAAGIAHDLIIDAWRFMYWHNGWGFPEPPHLPWWSAEDLQWAKDRAKILSYTLGWGSDDY